MEKQENQQLTEEKQNEGKVQKKPKKFKQKRKAWFRFMKKLMVCRYKKPEFVFLGEKPTNGAIIISNHEGTDAPLSLEMYCDFPIRFWGTGEMNSGLKNLYNYQTKVYYHEKKHWNLFLARMFCLIASPLTNLYYKGLNLISTYHDSRFRQTLKDSLKAIQDGDNVVIFPEKSDKGYLPELEGFYKGFLSFADVCKAKDIDVPIYVSYFKIKEKIYVFDKPVKYSSLIATGESRDQIAKKLLDRCNELGKMQFENHKKNKKKNKKTKNKICEAQNRGNVQVCKPQEKDNK